MTYIRNWPEGLFILIVMALPLAAAAGLGWGVVSFVVLLVAGMVAGLLAWLGLVWLVCRHRHNEEETSADARAAADRAGGSGLRG
jgi:hypothetical protein